MFCCLSISKSSLDWIQESPTLDLARDYSRFVIAFFDLINTSAPHIYISALTLSPRMSMVYEVYKQYVRPLARVVHGLQTLWEPVVATAYHNDPVTLAAWSPCDTLIAVVRSGAVEVRDAVTLNPLSTFRSPPGFRALLTFSPDSRLLTQLTHEGPVTWDLQTGGSIRATLPKGLSSGFSDTSSTYSVDGKILAIPCWDKSRQATFIATYDLFSLCTYPHPVPEGRLLNPIWTHGEFLRFATVKPGQITIWQVEFTLEHPPQAVESLPSPDEIADTDAFTGYLFLPALSRLAVTLHPTLLVWDARDSKFLLKPLSGCARRMTFSSDGRFFAYILVTDCDEVHVRKESPAGYILHQKAVFPSIPSSAGLLLSPNGESIITFIRSTIHLWHTKHSILPSDPTPVGRAENFIIGFSPDEASATFARRTGNTVTVIDLQSRDTRLTIDTGLEVICLGVNGSTIAVVSDEKVVSWNLVAGKARANVDDSVWMPPPDLLPQGFHYALVSPDLSRVIAFQQHSKPRHSYLKMYDTSTWKCLASTTVEGVLLSEPWFTPDGREIWRTGSPIRPSPLGLRIIDEGKSGIIKLQPLEGTELPPGGLPWRSSRGFEVTDDGWILSSTQKRLLWLPHGWRSGERSRRWTGRFLGLGHAELNEPVILEFFE